MSKVDVFAPQEIWDADFISYKDKYRSLVNYNDAISKLIYEKVEPVLADDQRDFFEIGCYLARYMYHFGKLGYTLNGIDQSTLMDEKFLSYLKNEGFKVGDIKVADVFKLDTTKKYDFVASYGFIEHFSNFLELIELHFEMAKSDGYVMITIPNFGGWIQYLIHKLLDEEHLNIHNIKALNPSVWKEHIKKYNYEVVFDGYLGGFDLWLGNQKRNIIQKIFAKILFYPGIINRLRKIKKSKASYSPYYCLLIKKC